jgi:hypothetical protein
MSTQNTGSKVDLVRRSMRFIGATRDFCAFLSALSPLRTRCKCENTQLLGETETHDWRT